MHRSYRLLNYSIMVVHCNVKNCVILLVHQIIPLVIKHKNTKHLLTDCAVSTKNYSDCCSDVETERSEV